METHQNFRFEVVAANSFYKNKDPRRVNDINNLAAGNPHRVCIWLKDSVAQWSRGGASPDTYVAFLYDDNVCKCAIAFQMRMGDEIFVDYLCAHPVRRGFGKLLMSWLETHIRTQYPSVKIMRLTPETDSMLFYRKLGFSAPDHAMCMTKILGRTQKL